MNDLEKGVLLLVKSAITGEKYALPDGFDLAEACAAVKRHHMVMLLYEGAMNCGIPKNDPTMRQLFQGYCRALLYSEGQQQELERLFNAFDQNHIDYLPLKGCIMKSLYPRPELRTMGDADILIRVEQYPQIIPVMKELGYEAGIESQHELVWDSPKLHVELHKCLIPERDETQKKWNGFFHEIWSRAELVAGNRYVMSDEDTFLFLFLHFTKHYARLGIGCRHVVDLWVYLRTHPALDHVHLEKALESLNLLTFYRNIRKLIRVWFDGEDMNDTVEVIHHFVFSCGSFGNRKNGMVAEQVRNERFTNMGTKTQYLLTRFLPKAELIQREYPILKKAPWLLPVIWVIRPIKKVFVQKNFIKRSFHMLSQIDDQNISQHEQMFKAVGLDLKYHKNE